MYTTLFMIYLEDLEKDTKNAKIFTDFIETSWIGRNYLQSATFAELVRDFIAGMTDRYFQKRYEECVIPRRVEGKFPLKPGLCSQSYFPLGRPSR